MQKIDAKKLAIACRKAYENGTLLAQNINDICSSSFKPKYGYEIKGHSGKTYHCAIGCGLNKGIIEEIVSRNFNRKPFRTLVDKGYLSCDRTYSDAIICLQIRHDNWLSITSSSLPFSNLRVEAEKLFCEALEKLEKLSTKR